MNFYLSFRGASSTPLVFYFQAWNGTVPLEEAKAMWAGGWTITGSSYWGDKKVTASQVVPEPFTMMTAFMAIGSFGVYIRKHTRRAPG